MIRGASRLALPMHMQHVDLGLRDAWALGLSYWESGQRWRARAMLAGLIALNLILVGTTVLFTYWQGAFYDALEAKDWREFIASLLWWTNTPRDGFTLGFAPGLTIFVFATAYELYLRQALQIKWRLWMTDEFITDWLSKRAYYRMALTDSGTDNPDQRVAEDIRLFVENALNLGLGLIRSAATLLSFVFLLWTLSEPILVKGFTIHGYLVWVALLYATFGTWFAHLVGRRLTPLHVVQQKAEADFRFSLMRLSENAEGIAFYGGESEQKRELSQRFSSVVSNWVGIMAVTLRLTFLTSSYAQIVLVFPLAVVAPAYFAGRMALGGIFQVSNAFVQVQTALSWVVQSYSDLTGWFATVQRLSGFRRAVARCQHAKTSSTDDGPKVISNGRHEFELCDLEINLPDGRELLRGVQMRIAQGERVLIQGPSGSGKSTLLRANAGIWPFGVGIIHQGAGRQMFLPQRPYMPLGTLKRAACYPFSEADFPDSDVSAALADVGLGHLVSELARTDTWERRLSGGEQQRLTLARALLIRPEWLFLDEATSGLDSASELRFYALLCERLPDTAFVSVAHRQAVARFHTRVVHIYQGGLREGALVPD